jgi:flagellar biosynthetic protein FliQ
MGQADVINIMKDAIYTTMIAAAPMLAVALVVGLIVSIFQATTQINEQTLAFVPKIVGILLSLVLFGPFILSTLQDYFIRLFQAVSGYIR